MTTKSNTFPSIRARMGDWIYYVTTMLFSDVREWIKRTDEIHNNKGLRDMIQRALTDRTSEIVDYLIRQEQRFFNAIIVGIYGGEPQWFPLDIGESPTMGTPNLDDRAKQSVGLLMFNGQEQIFAIDGQHRVEAIKAAINKDTNLAQEEICVIFVGHKTDEKGRERTRRLFSTLNRYAKPVSPGEIVALDEDDAFAVVTRKLVENYGPLTGNRVLFARTPPIPQNNKKAVTTILSLYELVQVIAVPKTKAGANERAELKKRRPSEEKIEAMYEEHCNFWDALREYIPPIKEVTDSDPEEEVASKYRTSDGGHILLRPAGQKAFANATRVMMDRGLSIKASVETLSRTNLNLNSLPWIGVLWDPTGQRMIKSVNMNLAQNLLLRMADQKTLPESYDLSAQYRKALRNPDANVEEDLKR